MVIETPKIKQQLRHFIVMVNLYWYLWKKLFIRLSQLSKPLGGIFVGMERSQK